MNEIKVITIKDNEDFLRQISREVVFPDPELNKDINLLERYFSQNNTTLALASIQIGIPKRIIYIKRTNLDLINKKLEGKTTEEEDRLDEHRILINPEVVSEEGLTDYWEACASCLDRVGHVVRPYRIVVNYLDEQGKPHSSTYEGFEATVLSHELDHLNGVLHIDIALEEREVPVEKRKEFRDNETNGYNVVATEGDFKELLRSSVLAKKK